MPTLKDLIKGAYNGEHLIVTGPHSDWLERLEHEQRPSKAALEHVIKVLMGVYKHERSGRFSPSSMGKCPRRIVFGWAGAPQLPPDIDSQEMMDHGSWTHLKWQMEGLTMGYMTGAEVWVHDDDLMTGGSIDATLDDGSIFELKSAAPSVYMRTVSDNGHPPWENLLQVHTYFLLEGSDWASVVYENRAWGSFHEFRIPRQNKIEKEVIRRLNSYRRYVEDDVLPPQLEMCEKKVGTEFKRCPYREICHIPKSVSASAELVGEESRTVPDDLALPDWATAMLSSMLVPEGSAHAR